MNKTLEDIRTLSRRECVNIGGGIASGMTLVTTIVGGVAYGWTVSLVMILCSPIFVFFWVILVYLIRGEWRRSCSRIRRKGGLRGVCPVSRFE